MPNDQGATAHPDPQRPATPIRVGLLGGSFNPIHFGHLIAARAVAEQLNLPRIVLIPAGIPPHKRPEELALAADRLAMTRLAVLGDPLFQVSDIELARPGPNYTIDTVIALRSAYAEESELFWIIGADTAPELVTWYRIADLLEVTRLVTVVRPGSTLGRERIGPLELKIGAVKLDQILQNSLATPAIDISATEIRRRVATGRSIRYLTPDCVADYIASHRLYGARAE